MPAVLNAIEHGAPAFRAALAAVIERGAGVLSISSAADRHVVTSATMLRPLERLLGSHGIGKDATESQLRAPIDYAGVHQTALAETISAVHYLRDSLTPVAGDVSGGANDIGQAISQLRMASFHA